MSEGISIDNKVLERKAFDIRNEDIYYYFLCQYQMFDYRNPNRLFPFSYDMKSDVLEDFGLKYEICRIAGSGSDLDKSIRLMNWVHQALPSGRKTVHLTDCTPDEILSQTDTIVNCCNHAMILNAALLAVGIYSRCIWCKPFDIANLEYHVVNAAYITQYDKWVMLDSANQVICFSDKGIPMDIMEIRQALIDNKSFRIGIDETRWRGRYASICKKKYIVYMKKNYYRFSCYVRSSYMQEKEKELVELVPEGYYPFEGSRKKFRNNVMLTCYYTTNVQAFWQTPG